MSNLVDTYKKVASSLTLEQLLDLQNDMRTLSDTFDNSLIDNHKYVLNDIVGWGYEAFLRTVESVIDDKLVDAWTETKRLLDSWIEKRVYVFINGPGSKASKMRGTLYRGKDYESEFGDYVVNNETQWLQFDMTQVQAATMDIFGCRVIVLDSPHCGIGLPSIETVE